MMKKAMGLLLAVAMMLTMVMSVSAADTTFTDLESKDCAEAVAVLSSLGVIQGRSETEYAPDANLTRAEMATILVRIMGAEGSAVSGDIFTDVKSDHWAYSNVAIAYKAGLIVGMGDGTFAPDANVTHVQLIKMLICALGYDVQAESQGGYPSGYYAKAAQLGMLDGISAEMDQAATRGNMAMILYNTIEVPLFDQATYGAGADGTYVESADTLLSRYMDIFVEEGTVSANYYTSITTPERACTANEVAVDSVVYNAGETDAADYLGMKVKVYYNGTKATDAEVPQILLVEPGKAAVAYDFTAAEISEETTSTKLFYEKDGKESSVSVNGDAKLIVNGQIEERAITASDLKPAIGTVKLICNNGSSADVVSVWTYTNYIVQSKDADDNLVYFKGVKTPLEMDPENKSVKSEFITSDGAEFDVNGVAKWDILSVAKSTDGKVLKVVKSNASVTGKVTETEEDVAAIDGVEYPVAEGAEQPELNTTAKFYLDFTGSIAAIDTNIDTGYKYGYIVSASYAKGIDGIAQFKMFTEEGEMKVFNAAAKVTVNDTSVSNTKVLDDFPKVVGYQKDNTGKVTSFITIRQLVKFVTNSNGEINEILTAADATGDVAASAESVNLNMVLDINSSGMPIVDGKAESYNASKTPIYIHNLGILGENLAVRASTRIFQIPAADAADEDYKILPSSEFPHREALPYVKAYDVTETYTLGAIVWDIAAAGVDTSVAKYWSSMDTPVGLITSIAKGLNSDMEEEYKITLVDWSGNVQKVTAGADLLCGYKAANTNKAEDKTVMEKNIEGVNLNAIKPDQLREGDMIRFEKNVLGELTVAAIVYRIETPGMYETSVTAGGGWAPTPAERVYIGGDLVANGTIELADADAIIGKTHLTDSSKNKGAEVIRTYPVGKIFMYDRETGEAKAITTNDIVVGDQYVALWRTITPMIFWIIR